MKKLSLVAAILTCTFAASAQKGKVNLANASLNENDLPTAKTMIDEALSNRNNFV